MERLLKAQRLAATDVERGVTMEMVRKNREAHASRKCENGRVTEKVNEIDHSIGAEIMKNEAVDNLLATIDATEALEHKLRAKYNL